MDYLKIHLQRVVSEGKTSLQWIEDLKNNNRWPGGFGLEEEMDTIIGHVQPTAGKVTKPVLLFGFKSPITEEALRELAPSIGLGPISVEAGLIVCNRYSDENMHFIGFLSDWIAMHPVIEHKGPLSEGKILLARNIGDRDTFPVEELRDAQLIPGRLTVWPSIPGRTFPPDAGFLFEDRS